MVMDHTAGDIWWITLRKVGCLQEEQAHRIFTHMVRAINYCQENSVARRDIKPDNVLLDGKEVSDCMTLAWPSKSPVGRSSKVVVWCVVWWGLIASVWQRWAIQLDLIIALCWQVQWDGVSSRAWYLEMCVCCACTPMLTANIQC